MLIHTSNVLLLLCFILSCSLSMKGKANRTRKTNHFASSDQTRALCCQKKLLWVDCFVSSLLEEGIENPKRAVLNPSVWKPHLAAARTCCNTHTGLSAAYGSCLVSICMSQCVLNNIFNYLSVICMLCNDANPSLWFGLLYQLFCILSLPITYTFNFTLYF